MAWGGVLRERWWAVEVPKMPAPRMRVVGWGVGVGVGIGMAGCWVGLDGRGLG